MSTPPKARTRLPVRSIALGLTLVVLGLTAVVSARIEQRIDPRPHVAVLDALPIPATWELADEEIYQRIWLGSSRVVRYYLVDADPSEAIGVSERLLGKAGFTIDDEDSLLDFGWCDERPIGAPPTMGCLGERTGPCFANGRAGPVTCTIRATRGGECMAVTALDRGQRATYFRGSDGIHISDPVRIVVRLTVHYPGRC